MTSLIEAVARGIDPGAWEDVLPTPTRADTEAYFERRNKSCAKAASVVAAINASGTHVVRQIEPTEAMIQAGCDEGPVGCCPLDPDMVVAIYRAMIKASQGDE